jgi:predicted secreted protein with PEFG-CTERM motif
MEGGWIKQLKPNSQNNSLVIDVTTIKSGELDLILPRTIIDAKSEKNDDVSFLVIVDGKKTDIVDTKIHSLRMLTIPVPSGAEKIEIIGSSVIPEFKELTLMVLGSSFLLIALIGRKFRNIWKSKD